MKTYPVVNDEYGDRSVIINVTVPVVITLDEDDNSKRLTAEEVDGYINEMERVDLGEQLLNHLSVKLSL